MSHRRNLCRLVLATLAAASVAAPAASAIPVDPTGPAAAFDARGEAAASGGGDERSTTIIRDARGESAASGGPTGRPLNRGPFPGPPTWPESPAPLPARTAPIPGGDGADGGGVDLPVVLLIIAGTLAIGGGMAVAARRVGTRTAH